VGKTIVLQGLQQPPPNPSRISAKQVYKSSQGNDIWAYVIVVPIQDAPLPPQPKQMMAEDLQLLLATYADVFQDPKSLPPPRSYDHSIPL
jgi:hypothetical protein